MSSGRFFKGFLSFFRWVFHRFQVMLLLVFSHECFMNVSQWFQVVLEGFLVLSECFLLVFESVLLVFFHAFSVFSCVFSVVSGCFFPVFSDCFHGVQVIFQSVHCFLTVFTLFSRSFRVGFPCLPDFFRFFCLFLVACSRGTSPS